MVRGGLVVVEGKRIKYIGKTYAGNVDRWINASGCLVMPGLINTHIHASTTPKDKSFLKDSEARYCQLSDNHPFKKTIDEVSPPSVKSWDGEI